LSSSDATKGPVRDPKFHTTRWSVVLAAGDHAQDDASQALAELCQTYWFPVYAFVRRRVADSNQAQDLTQEFFTRLLEKDFLGRVRRDRGRFRSYLLTAVSRFLAKEWSKAKTLKRGGGTRTLSLDFAWGESRLDHEPAVRETPEHAFDRLWAVQLLELVHNRLENEYGDAGKRQQYEQLRPFLVASGQNEPQDLVAQRLGMTGGAFRTAVYRLRRRFRQLVLNEIAHTVSELDEVDDEVQRLFASLG
jgi:DNA-directed RNA polymerase specialized sigma24 family protein